MANPYSLVIGEQTRVQVHRDGVLVFDSEGGGGGGRPRLPPGTIENHNFAQAPTHTYSFNTNVIPQVQAAGIPLYGFRHNLTMVRNAEGSFQGPWRYDRVGNSTIPYSIQWDAMHDAGLYLLGCLFEGGNGGDYPKTEVERGYWADQAVAMMLHIEAGWPGMLVAVEVENEPDGNWPVPAVDMALIAAALKSKVRAHPELDHIPIIGPAVVASPGPSPTSYVSTFINAGGLDHIDYWSIHIYAPANKWMSRETILRPKFVAAGHPDMKMIITEWGGHGTSNRHESVADGAAMLAAGFKGSSYFPIRDMGGFENNGFLNRDGSLAEQGQTHLKFLELLGWDATYVGEDVLDAHVVSYHFTKNGQHIRVMWSHTDTPKTISVTGSYTVRDYDGNELNNEGQLQVLNVPPIYLFGDVTVAMAPAAQQDVLVADSIAGFSTTQGQNGWTYQYLEGDTYIDATADAAGNRWIHQSYAAWQLGQINMQPVVNATGTAAVCSVRKWTVPAGVSRVRVRAIWQRVSLAGDGAGLSLWHWRGSVATRYFDRRDLMGTSVDFIRVFDVVEGDVVEFRADTGPALNAVSDETKLNVCKIYKTAGPVT